MIRGSQTKTAVGALVGPEPDGVSKLVQEMDQDYIVALADRTFRTTVKQANVTVVSDGTFARANLIAEQMQDLYWLKLPAMLDFVKYGRVAFEKVWGWDGQVNTLQLDELPYDYTEMRMADDGTFEGIRLKPQDERKEPIDLDAAYSWWLALDPTPLNPHGKSRYVGAPEKLWKDRKENFRLLGVFIKRFVLGGGIAHIPDQIEDPDRPGEFIDGFEAFCKQYDALLSGGVLAVSNEREPGKDGLPGGYVYDVEKLETEVKDGRPLLDIIAASDAWMLLAFGFPPKTILEGDAVGSFALVSMQMLLLWSVADEIVAQLVESYQAYVVDKVAAINGVTGVEVNYVPLTERPDDLANELLKAWLTTPQLSPLVAAVDLEAVFDAVGIPVSNDAMAKLQKVQAGLLTVAPPPAQTSLQFASPFLSRLWK